MSDNVELVEIEKDVLEELKSDSEFLGCLMACGVDNWNGYEQAQEMME